MVGPFTAALIFHTSHDANQEQKLIRVLGAFQGAWRYMTAKSFRDRE
jgi:hypothetical protein